MTPDVTEKLKLLPDLPGVYRFYGAEERLLYVGKAKNLKNRVKSYFLASNKDDHRTSRFVPQILDVQWIVTHSESEALILEDQLIKKQKPKYNITLRDDKTYPYFKLTIGEMFPRLSLTRHLKKDGSLYFGPYVSVMEARKAEKVILKNFPLRLSKMVLDGSKTYRPCLNFQMGRCLAPCGNRINVEEYAKIVSDVLQILKGNSEDLIKKLKEEMSVKAEAMQYEAAGKLRDQIKSVEVTLLKQQKVSTNKIDQDIFALVRDGGFAGIQAMFVRAGVLLSDDFFFFKEGGNYNDEELLRSILSKLYVAGGSPLPKEVILPFLDEDLKMLEGYFTEQRGTKVEVLSPQRGERKSLIDWATKNAWESLKLKMQASEADDLILDETKEYLHLTHQPYRVECFDISNISGTNNVASMVVFENNKPLKSDYRKFKIKSFEGANDFAAMEEVLTRRYSRLIEEGGEYPSLILIDGGKGQVSSALRVLMNIKADFTKFDLVGLAKGRSEKRRGAVKVADDFEYIVKPNQKNTIPLKQNSKPLHFLQRVRDEAHRFAISFHRQQRGKESITSSLESIPGIGPKKRTALLTHFGNLRAIVNASRAEFEKTPGLSVKDAKVLFDFFQAVEASSEQKD